MDKSIKELVFLCVEMILIGVLVMFISTLTIPANELNSINEDNKVISRSLSEYRELYLYDDRYVSGDDVLLLLQKYKNSYTYYVDIDPSVDVKYMCVNGAFVSRYARLKNANGDDMSCWDTDALTGFLDINVYKSGYTQRETTIYKSKLIRMTEDELLDSMNSHLSYGSAGSVSGDPISDSRKYFMFRPNIKLEDIDNYYSDMSKDSTREILGVVLERNDAEYKDETINIKK